MIWFTSDLHLGHEGVIRYCDRPFAGVKSMDDALFQKWNEKVRPEDTIYILGDWSFHRWEEGREWLTSLRGKKILIRGNHDSYSYGQYHSLGIDVYEEAVIKLAGNRVRLSHYPYRPTAEELQTMDAIPGYRKYEDRRPPRFETEWLLHGHCHNAWKQRGRQINVGVDVWKFAPISQRQIESLIGLELEREKREGRTRIEGSAN